jgi:hypothetical protein
MAAPRKAPIKSADSQAKTLSITTGHSAVNGASLEEQIRQRAYELYEQRGRYDGFAKEDWLQAEVEIRGRQVKRSA